MKNVPHIGLIYRLNLVLNKKGIQVMLFFFFNFNCNVKKQCNIIPLNCQHNGSYDTFVWLFVLNSKCMCVGKIYFFLFLLWHKKRSNSKQTVCNIKFYTTKAIHKEHVIAKCNNLLYLCSVAFNVNISITNRKKLI